MTTIPVRPTPEQLAAFADDELSGAERDAVAAAIAAEPALAAEVARHRALRDRLTAHFAPIAEEDLPDRLRAPFETRAQVVDLAAARRERALPRVPPAERPARRRRWGWIAAPALAASLALALFVPRGEDPAVDYAGASLAAALDNQLAGSQGAGAETRILLSFQREGGDYCRAFASPEDGGIACRDSRGWQVVAHVAGGSAQSGEFRQAGNPQGDLMALAQEMASGGALDSEQEAAARAKGWR